MKEETKYALYDIGISVIMGLLVAFCIYLGLGLIKMHTTDGILSLIVVVAGCFYLVVSMCMFILSLEMLCRGIRNLNKKKN